MIIRRAAKRIHNPDPIVLDSKPVTNPSTHDHHLTDRLRNH